MDGRDPEPRLLRSGAALAAGSRVVVAITGAATTVLVARLLGPAGSGSFALALTLVLMLTTFSSLGVEHGIAFHVSGRRWAPRPAFAGALRVGLAAGLLAALAGIALRLVVPDAFAGLSVGRVAVVCAALPFALAWFLTSYVALSVDRYELYVAAPVVQSVVALAGVAVLGATHGLGGALVALTASHVIAAAVTVLGGARTLPDRAVAEPLARPLRAAAAFGVKGYGANALQFLNFRLDLFVLSAVASRADVGHYAVAVSVAGVLLLLPQALNEVLFPRIAALQGDEAQRELVETKSLRHLALIAVVVGAGLAVALLVLVVPVYGADFRPAIALGLILLPGLALLGITGALGASIVGRGHPGLSLRIALVTTPITLALYALLIPLLDATGAALASTLSYALTFVLSARAFRQVSGRSAWRSLRPGREELRDLRGILAR